MHTRRKVLTLGLFEKRIEGDDCLLELARRRFHEAGLGVEMHAGSPEQLDCLMKFRPAEETPVVVHLPREFDLAQKQSRDRIMDFAARFAGRIYGLVIHDQAGLAARRAQYVEAAWELEYRLAEIKACPFLFVEYAAGIEPAQFSRFFAAIQDLDRVSACVDIGHVGIRQARAAYAHRHAGQDICALKSQGARLPQLIDDVEAAVQAGAAAALDLVDALGEHKKPLHFHLHDAHPLSTVSPFGVSDHLSFFTEVPLSFEHNGRCAAPPMFGPEGLSKLVARAIKAIGSRGLSFTLEIHPAGERAPLGEATSLFDGWADKSNAEKMNGWLLVLARNHALLQDAIQAASHRETSHVRPSPPAPTLP